MARINVNPTRMELTKLKRKLKTATRGHKLLKDKLDELMKQFLDIVRRNMELRVEVEKHLNVAQKNFIIARAVMSDDVLTAALMLPKQSVKVTVDNKNIMSVNVPRFTFEMQGTQADCYPYGFAFTTGELDVAVNSFSAALKPMLELAEMEKTSQLLAQEIEKTRRRVNALENVLLPNIKETIKYISMKLEETERSATIRLMKVKDMMIKQQIEANSLM